MGIKFILHYILKIYEIKMDTINRLKIISPIILALIILFMLIFREKILLISYYIFNISIVKMTIITIISISIYTFCFGLLIFMCDLVLGHPLVKYLLKEEYIK